MGSRRTVTRLFLSLLRLIRGSRMVGHTCCCPLGRSVAPASLHASPFSWDGLPFNINQPASFLVYLKNLPCRLLQSGFHDQLAAQWSLDQIQFNCLALYISVCKEIHQKIQQSPFGLRWHKINLRASYTLYSSTKPDQNQSMWWITLIPLTHSRKVAGKAKLCQSDLMLNAQDELLFKEITVTLFVKRIIIS